MPSDKFFLGGGALEPLAISIPQAMAATGESRSQVYVHIARGEYEAIKSGSRTLIVYESVKRYFAKLPRAVIKAPAPRPRKGRETRKAEAGA